MKFFVISDIHLKPWILDCADNAILRFNPDRIVLLGDYVDDWGTSSAPLVPYEATMQRLAEFSANHPDAIWLWGNHDISYLHSDCQGCSGHSAFASIMLPNLFNELERSTCAGFRFVYYEDGIFFSHAGIASAWVKDFSGEISDNAAIAQWINETSLGAMWDSTSPVWYRPQDNLPLFSNNGIVQIVGHTPVNQITRWQNAIFTDVFSTYSDTRKPIGTEEFFMYDSSDHSGLCIDARTLAVKTFG